MESSNILYGSTRFLHALPPSSILSLVRFGAFLSSFLSFWFTQLFSYFTTVLCGCLCGKTSIKDSNYFFEKQRWFSDVTREYSIIIFFFGSVNHLTAVSIQNFSSVESTPKSAISYSSMPLVEQVWKKSRTKPY